MSTSRLAAFSDGVIAIIITIMVLELEIPHETDLDALTPLIPVFLTYLLSFVNIGIYWNNHHHLLHATESVNGKVLWANLHLLFWLSLFPFATGWMGQNDFAEVPTAAYGIILLLAALAYTILQTAIVRQQPPDSQLAAALGNDLKGKISVAIYVSACGLAFVNPWIAVALYVVVSIMWLVPDRRIESSLADLRAAD